MTKPMAIFFRDLRVVPTKLLLAGLLCTLFACAGTETGRIYPDAAFFSREITIIDIRTEPEWRRTGVVKGAKTITFFAEDGNYNEAEFIEQLNQIVKKDEEFAIICRSGARSRRAAKYLTQAGYKVIDLKGGVKYLPKIGVNLVPYPQP